jgi:hypothetical protein
LSCICQGAAIYVLVIGVFRTWRSQNAIVRGKTISGGFEIVLLAGGVLVVSFAKSFSFRETLTDGFYLDLDTFSGSLDRSGY